MNTQKFVRKPFEVEAAQVTAENLEEVAAWCRGTVNTDGPGGTEPGDAYVKVTVARALNERQTKAFVGDWVLQAGNGFKVYTSKAFNKSFEPSLGERKDAAVQATKGSPVPIERRIAPTDEVVTEVPPTSNVIAGSSQQNAEAAGKALAG